MDIVIRRLGLGLAIGLLAASPAAATITDLSFHGGGIVTYSVPDPGYGLTGPAIGQPVVVDVHIHLGTATGDPAVQYPAAPPDGFTGRFTMTTDMTFDHYSTFSWTVTPGDSASSLDQASEYTAGYVDFINGRATDFSLTHIGDPDGHYISTAEWGFDFGADSSATWGGTWTPDSIASSTPEPSTWLMLVAGFGLVGMGVRRRHAALA